MTTLGPLQPCAPCLRNYDTRACETARVGPSRVRMSEDKVRRKDLYGSVRVVYVLEKLPDVSGPGLVEAGRYRMVSEQD